MHLSSQPQIVMYTFVLFLEQFFAQFKVVEIAGIMKPGLAL